MGALAEQITEGDVTTETIEAPQRCKCGCGSPVAGINPRFLKGHKPKYLKSKAELKSATKGRAPKAVTDTPKDMRGVLVIIEQQIGKTRRKLQKLEALRVTLNEL